MKWEFKYLHEIASTSSGGTPSRTIESYWNGDIPWIKSGQLKDGFITECDEFITEEGLKNSSASIVESGTLLLALYGATAGKLAFTTFEAATNQAVCSIFTNCSLVKNKYLFYFLLSIRSKILNDAAGGAQPNISQGYVKNIKVPLPPLHIQEQIADTLDKADALRRKDQELLQKYDELAQAIFYDMFGDPVRNERGWDVKKLGELTDHISSGSTPLGGSNVYKTNGILFVRSQNVLMRSFDISDAVYITEETHQKMKRTWVKENDVLLNITGASIGRVGVYKYKQIANVNQHVCIIRCIKDLVNPDYLMYLLASHTYQNQIIGRSSGGTRESFTFAQIKQFDIILPPIEKQKIFMKKIYTLNNIISSIKDTTEASNKLYKSLISSNFR